VLFISDVPFEELGFVTPPSSQPLPVLTATALNDVPTVVTVGTALLAVLYWITRRRQEVALAESAERTAEDTSPPDSWFESGERS